MSIFVKHQVMLRGIAKGDGETPRGYVDANKLSWACLLGALLGALASHISSQ